jgi:hypothetical protein
MLNRTSGVSRLECALICASILLGIAPMAGAEVYAWRTDDGGYAYTDDRDQIPARYRAQATAQQRAPLASYERYTRQDDEATAHYAERLARRLQALRAANAEPHPAVAAASAASPGTLMVSTGGENGSQIEVPMAAAGPPVVIDPGLTKRDGDFRTRRVTVVRQGDRTIAVIKGPQHNFDPIDSIQDEDALEQGD